MAKTGRPSTYTDEIGNEICQRIACGETLVNICKDAHTPAYITVLHWRTKLPEFGKMYARAREDQADTLADEIIAAVKEDCATDELGRVDNGAVAAKRLMVDAMKWRAAKLGPKTYGEKIQQQVTGADGGPVFVVTGVPTLADEPKPDDA